MAKSLTAANAVITLSVTGLFTTPQQLQGFSADDVYGVDKLKSTEVLMGVDGKLSGGFVFMPIVQNFSLQADSDSCDIFDQWWAAQQRNRDVFTATGYTSLPSLQQAFRSTKGFLTDISPIPSAGRTIAKREFTITWESVLAVPL